MTPTVGILTISDRGAAGTYEDRSGPVIREIVTNHLKGVISQAKIVPDDIEIISQTLIDWCNHQAVDLILTTG
ncbi:MAG: molybdopterin-binding protein, partial [Chloroflexota bacterium]